MSLEKRFMERLDGLRRAHGIYVLTGKRSAKGKAEGKAKTLKEPVTEALWKDHLEGKVGLGIVPVDDVGLTSFGAIDIDVYDLDLLQLEREIREKGLPLILCRTKSGGAHLFIFYKERAPAKEVRRRLKGYAEALGYPKAEIFPKQDKIESEKDCGSWINMPYFGDSRNAIYLGRELTAEDFLAVADEMAVGDEKKIEGFEGAPPCFRILEREIEEGCRDNMAFNVCVYCRKRHGEGWQDEARFLIRKHIPSFGKEDTRKTVNSVGKKDRYFYRCSQEPLASLCDKALCAEAEYGIDRAPDPGIRLENLRKHLTQPPEWEVEVNGKKLKITDTEDLIQQNRFQKACMNAFDILPNKIGAKDWERIIQNLLKTVKPIPAPEDAGRGGEFLGMIQGYFGERAKARHRDELTIGKPYEEDGWTYFNSTALIEWLKKKRFVITAKEAWSILKEQGAELTPVQKIKGKPIRLWKIPSSLYSKQTEPLDLPEIPKEEPKF